MKFRIVPTKDIELVQSLHGAVFPDDTFDETPEEGNVYWKAVDQDKTPVGFCSVRPASGPGTVFLSRAGVLPEARGHRLQQRFIRVRLNWARRKGYRWAITYTWLSNVASARNLIACGFKLYRPEYLWAGDNDVMYFILDLRPNLGTQKSKAHSKFRQRTTTASNRSEACGSSHRREPRGLAGSSVSQPTRET